MSIRVRLLVTMAVLCGVTAASSGTSYASGVTVTDLNNGATASGLAQSLVGGGVSISNVTYTGDNRAAGSFTGGASSIGFGSGIVLSSGKVQTYPADSPCSRGVEGPNNCYEATGANPPGPDGAANSTAFGQPGDADLTALSGFPTFDAAVLQFDFVPTESTIQFKYVFGSEEYSDFANTAFNDVLGLFVNGTNCAVVPGTTSPVSVNTINNGNDVGGDPTPHNAQYFRDNVRPNGPTIDSQFDGLTTVLSCTATVNPGVTNHLKLAIADASDDVLDSGFFVEAGSLVSGTQISTSLSGGGQTGANITVPTNTAVTDASTLTGATTSSASGTVSYKVYSDTNCTNQVADGGTKTVSSGSVPNSDPVTLNQAGTYYWQASYSGDAANNPSKSACGDETETVQPPSDPHVSATGQSLTATEGQSFSGTVATFTDPDTNATAGEYSATINWGDGSSASTGTITGSGGSFVVSGSHTYNDEGSHTATVTITDTDNASNNATPTDTATVNDAALHASGAVSPTSPQSFNGPVATFKDDNSTTSSTADFTSGGGSVTIDWGDGGTSPGTVTGSGGSYTVSGSHNYTSTGYFTIKLHIVDDGGSTADAQSKVLIFGTAKGGNFVIGDQNSAPGTAVTFWGAQWWKLNSLSGGAAPASFKGFEDTPSSVSCGTSWTTDPGNSTPPPPGPLPAFMAVIVSSQISKSGSTISGNTVHMVVVQTNPGYAPDPGHPGIGTVVATIC